MAEFIKAYNEREDTVLEVSVIALTDEGAKTRGTLWLFGRTPANLMGLEGIEVFELDPEGITSEYRVMLKFDSRDGVLGMIKNSELAQKIKREL